MVEAAVVRLCEACLEAPLCESPWQHVSDAIARELDGIAVTITLAPGWSPHGPGFASGIDPAAIDQLRAHYHALNPWARASALYPEGYFGSAFEMISPSELRRTAYFNDWMKPAGIGSEFIFGGLPVVRDGVDELLLAFFGLRGAREPRPEELDFGRRVVPQLARLWQILERRAPSRATRDDAAAHPTASPTDDSTGEPTAPLTQRERDVLALVAKGLTHRDCARLLAIGPATVKTHIKAIYRKLEISSRAEAAREALLRGLID